MPDKTNLMVDECSNGAILLDIGANVGMYTVYMADKPSSKVYAFEPEPENLKKLREKVKDKLNVEVHGVALSDHTGVDKLMIHPGNPGGHSMQKSLDGQRWKHKLDNSILVAVITLDEWCGYNNITRLDGIKIDVEAHEEAVIKGGMETLKKYHPLISLETHQTVDLDNLKSMLEECDYEVPELKWDGAYLFRPIGKNATENEQNIKTL